MSLTVPPLLIRQAEVGDVDDQAFSACIRESLPYAWNLVSGLAERLRAGTAEFTDNQTPPPDEAARGQLLRLLASDAMRATVERHFGVRLAFQNCHRVALFRPGAVDALREFTTPRAQILNQQPELVDC
jgi:NucS shadow ORF